MADRHLLHLSHAGLSARRWQNGRLTDESRFADDDSGHAAFAAYLAAHPKARFTLLVDLADESFHVETLPALRSRDRRRLIARRQAQLHLDTPYITHLSLGREAAGRRNERVLFAALTRPAAIRCWLKALARCDAVLTGVHSAALLGGPLLRAAKFEAPQALLAMVSPAGLRISCFEHGRLRFSRLVRGLTPASPALWEACRDEVQRTAQYLLGQRALERGAATPALILAEPDQHPAIRETFADSPDLRFVPIDLADLAARCGLRQAPTDSDALPLLLHLAARSRHQAQLAPPGELHQQRLIHIGTALGVAAASLLSASLVVAAKNFIEARQFHQQAVVTHDAALAEENRATALSAATPALPHPPEALQADFVRLAALERFAAGPSPFFHQLARILDKQPEIELMQLDWAATRASKPVQAIRIDVALRADARAAAADHFLAALRQIPGTEIVIEGIPAELDDTRALHPTSASAPSDARLSLRAKLPPPTP